jgi:hypothetical protein
VQEPGGSLPPAQICPLHDTHQKQGDPGTATRWSSLPDARGAATAVLGAARHSAWRRARGWRGELSPPPCPSSPDAHRGVSTATRPAHPAEARASTASGCCAPVCQKAVTVTQPAQRSLRLVSSCAPPSPGAPSHRTGCTSTSHSESARSATLSRAARGAGGGAIFACVVTWTERRPHFVKHDSRHQQLHLTAASHTWACLVAHHDARHQWWSGAVSPGRQLLYGAAALRAFACISHHVDRTALLPTRVHAAEPPAARSQGSAQWGGGGAHFTQLAGRRRAGDGPPGRGATQPDCFFAACACVVHVSTVTWWRGDPGWAVASTHKLCARRRGHSRACACASFAVAAPSGHGRQRLPRRVDLHASRDGPVPSPGGRTCPGRPSRGLLRASGPWGGSTSCGRGRPRRRQRW